MTSLPPTEHKMSNKWAHTQKIKNKKLGKMTNFI